MFQYYYSNLPPIPMSVVRTSSQHEYEEIAEYRQTNLNSHQRSVASSRSKSVASRPVNTRSKEAFDIRTYTCPAYAPTVPKKNKIEGEYATMLEK